MSLTLALACAAKQPSTEPEPIEPEPVVFVESVPDGQTRPPATTRPAAIEADRERAKQLFMDGMLGFESGDLAAALASFEQAYALEPLPALLFNIARCHEQLGDTTEACFAYLQIDADPDADQNTRQVAAHRAAALGC